MFRTVSSNESVDHSGMHAMNVKVGRRESDKIDPLAIHRSLHLSTLFQFEITSVRSSIILYFYTLFTHYQLFILFT